MEKLSVWREEDLPKGRKAPDSKWVFKLKFDPQTGERRFRSRICLRGFRQEEGIDFSVDKISSRVARLEGVRAILSIAAEGKLHLHQSDVKMAFLAGAVAM